MFIEDAEADANEIALLRELGYDSLLMLALEGIDTPWGLVEVYDGKARRFDAEDLKVAQGLAREVGVMVRRLERGE